MSSFLDVRKRQHRNIKPLTSSESSVDSELKIGIKKSSRPSRVSFRSSSLRSIRKILPNVKVAVYQADEKVGDAAMKSSYDANKKDTESFGSFTHGPGYLHLEELKPRHHVFWPTVDICNAIPKDEHTVIAGLAEMIIYICFIVLLTIVLSDLKPATRYHFENALRRNVKFQVYNLEERDIFLDSEVPRFEDIRNTYHFRQFMDNLIDSPLMFDFYQRSARLPVEDKIDMLFHYNRVMTDITVRQLRTPSNSCMIPQQMRGKIHVCYSSYDVDHYKNFKPKIQVEELNRFDDVQLGQLYLTPDWEYRVWSKGLDWDETQDGSYPHEGYYSYLQGGENGTLGSTRAYDHKMLMILFQACGWIRRETRAIIVDFTVYNPHVQLMCQVKTIFEYLPSGGVLPSLQLTTVKYYHLVRKYDYFLLGCLSAITAYTGFFLVEEVRELCFFRAKYFFRFWAWVDIFSITFLAQALMNLAAVIQRTKRDTTLWLKYEGAPVFEQTIRWNHYYDSHMCVLSFISFLKLFRYVTFFSNLDRFARTLADAVQSLIGFVLRFTVLFLAYAQLGYFLFGSHNPEFCDMGRASFTIIRFFLGYVNFESLIHEKYVAGIFYYLGMQVLMFILLGYMLVVIVTFYSLNESETIIKKGPTAWGMITVWFRKIYYAIKNQRKGELPTESITIEELIETLDILNFTEPEIDLFLRKYHIHVKYTADPNEVSLRITELLEQIKHRIRKDASTKITDMYQPAKEMKVKPLTLKEYKNLLRRLNGLELHTETLTERSIRILRISHVGAKFNQPIKIKLSDFE